MHVFDMNAWLKGSVKCIEQNSKGVRDIGGPKTHIRNSPFLYVKFSSVNTFINQNQDICVQMNMINVAMILQFGTEIYLQRNQAIVT